jgi:hypothetical protein
MGDVPALGQHTHSLLLESGMNPDAADDAIAQRIAYQADQFQPVSR